MTLRFVSLLALGVASVWGADQNPPARPARSVPQPVRVAPAPRAVVAPSRPAPVYRPVVVKQPRVVVVKEPRVRVVAPRVVAPAAVLVERPRAVTVLAPGVVPIAPVVVAPVIAGPVVFPSAVLMAGPMPAVMNCPTCRPLCWVTSSQNTYDAYSGELVDHFLCVEVRYNRYVDEWERQASAAAAVAAANPPAPASDDTEPVAPPEYPQ